MQTMIAPSPTVRPLEAAEIRQHISEGGQLIALGQRVAAAVRLWTAFEAAVRFSLTELGQRTDDPIWISDTPYGLSTQAVAYGVIDPEDRDVLLRFLPMRDAAAHGNAEAIDASVLEDVSRLAERTLDEMEQQSDWYKQSTAKESSMTITSTHFINFASGLGSTPVLTTRGKPFTVAVRAGSIYVTPLSTGQVQYPFTANGVQKALSVYNQTASETPTDYKPHIRHYSYFVGILKLYLAQPQQQALRPNQQ